MKILFYNHTGQVSGAERVLQMILRDLDRDRFELVGACPPNSRMTELLKGEALRVRDICALEARFTWRLDWLAKYLFSFAKTIRDARRVVREESPNVIHANSIRAGIVMAAATIGLDVPVIWHAHDILPHHPLSTLVRLFAVSSRRNRIVAVSTAVAERFRGKLPRLLSRRLPVTVVHNAVDVGRFRPDHKVRTESRASLGVREGQLVVGIVGQLTPRKGQLELIQAFAKTVHEFPNAKLLIIGEPLFNRDEDYAVQLRETALSLGIDDRVSFLGARSDIPQLMQAMDVLVVNSHEEPFALTVLEGLGSGIAVLATNVGGTPEMITHGQNGYLIVPRVDALARALVMLVTDGELRARLGHNARRAAEERFTINRFVCGIDTYYSQIPQRAARKITQKVLGEKLATD